MGLCVCVCVYVCLCAQLAHNESHYLTDRPYQYTLQITEEEALFPELFTPQLTKREAKAHKAARAAHIEEARRLAAGQGGGAAKPLIQGAWEQGDREQ